jgi:hypothetical protein
MLPITSVGDPTDSPPTSPSKNHSRKRVNLEMTLVSPRKHQPGEFVGRAGDSTSLMGDATVVQTDTRLLLLCPMAAVSHCFYTCRRSESDFPTENRRVAGLQINNVGFYYCITTTAPTTNTVPVCYRYVPLSPVYSTVCSDFSSCKNPCS